jgi:hypothetical protein
MGGYVFWFEWRAVDGMKGKSRLQGIIKSLWVKKTGKWAAHWRAGRRMGAPDWPGAW